jgi:hypothetical protein
VEATSSGLHSIGPLRFQAWNPEWAFHLHAAESALKELLPRLLVHHLDRRPGRPPVQRRQQERPVVQVRRLHFEPQALRLHVDLDLHLLPGPQERPVPRPGRNQ